MIRIMILVSLILPNTGPISIGTWHIRHYISRPTPLLAIDSGAVASHKRREQLARKFLSLRDRAYTT